MEVHLAPDKEEQLARIAMQRGVDKDALAREVLQQYLEDDTRFIEAVNLGLAAAERGEFVEHEDVWRNIENILKS